MKRILGFIFILSSLPILLSADNSGKAEITILSSSPDETILSIKLPPLQIAGDDIRTLSMGELEVLQKEGYPPLPFVSGIIAVSDKGGFDAAIINSEEYIITLSKPSALLHDEYPARQLVLETPQIMRDYRIVRFQFFPVTYNADKNEIRIVRNAVIRIQSTSKRGKNEKHFTRECISSAFLNLYRSSLLNFDYVERFSSDTVLMLIITPDAYYNYLLPFTEWKEKTGILTRLVKFSDFNPNPTFSDIRNYIENAYNTWAHPPDYFLAIGDAGIFPIRYTYDYSGYPGSYANDNYYVSLNGPNDIFPDIFGGRFPIQNNFHVETIVNKIVNYEQDPYVLETTWYKYATVVACDQYPTQAATKRRIREQLLDYGFHYVDSVYAENYWSSSIISAVIANAVNGGRCFVNYRGTGWASGWYASFGYIFNTGQVASLVNGRKLPIVTGIGCGVAKFDEWNCFGEQWIRNGSPTSEKGAVGFCGPTWNSHTRHNNKLDRGIYRGILNEGLTTFGEVITRGKYFMYEICGASDTTDTQMNEYLILGDPSLLFKTDVPESMIVSHPSTVPFGESVLWVSVRNENGPLANAFVCARMEASLHVSRHTDATGMVGLPISVLIQDTLFISVVAQNHFVYQGFCLVDAAGPFPVFRSYTIDDDTFQTSYGNGDGIANPGEMIEMPVVLMNHGNEEIIGVYALLSTDDMYVTINDSIETFGTIAAGDSATSPDDYDFTIASSTPDEHRIFFKLAIHDTNDSLWFSQFEVLVSSPVLKLINFSIDDSGQPDPNLILDPGETVNLTCKLKNDGSVEARNVSAVLRSENPYIQCIDSLSDYGNIAAQEEKSGTPFIVSADSLTPGGFDADMKLIISSVDGYSDTISFCITVGMGNDFFIWDADPNHTSGPMLFTSLAACGYRGKYSTTIGDHLHMLNAFSAVFICLGIYPDNYVLTNGQAVDSLCSYILQDGRMYIEGGDTWAHDVPTNLHPYFRIPELYDGSDDTQSIYGRNGTFTNQMSFAYAGENHWMDQLMITGGSFYIFRNSNPYYMNGVAYDGSQYKTIGLSFEFGGLVDGSPPSTKEALADSIMHFFGIFATGVEDNVDKPLNIPRVYGLSQAYPNPCEGHAVIKYQIPQKSEIHLKIYDVSGRLVDVLVSGEVDPGYHHARLDTKSYVSGVYFYRLAAGNKTFTRKMVVVK